MTKLVLSIIATILITTIVTFYLLNARFESKGNERLLNFDLCSQRCENLPFGVYLDLFEEFNLCTKFNDSIRALARDCSHIFDSEARTRCMERNIAQFEKMKECTLPIPPRYQDYLDCKEFNRIIRRQIPTCLPYKPNFEACLKRADTLYNQLTNCDSILKISELEYIKCKRICNDMFSRI